MSQPALNILMSQQGIDAHGAEIERILCAAPSTSSGRTEGLRWLTLESKPDADGTYPVDVSFITRDITGASTKTNILPTLARYYEMLRASPKLQWVHVHSAGADRPIFAELLARGVSVTTSSGANASPVAHTAVAAVLALALGRQFPVQIAAQQRRDYTPMTNHPKLHDLVGQTALVVGLGAIGSLITKYLTALDIQVIGITRSNFLELKQHLHSVDFLVLACPLTPQTKGLVNAELMAHMKQGSYLVNVARGEVCVESDVIAALQSGQLGGAFLDGFEVEPLGTDSPLWSLPNVMLSAHTAGHFTGHAINVATIFRDNLIRFVQGAALLNEVRVNL
jgi:phosphoglycerate dehydrogenase-like enzyme